MYLDRMTGLIMLGAGGGGGSAGGGSCKFYECASVDDGNGSPAIKAGITISGDITESTKGFYSPQGDTSDLATAVWGNGSYYLYKCNGYDYWIISPSLNDGDPGNAYYYAEYRSGEPPWKASNWQGNYGGGTVKITGSLIDVPEVPATGVKSWTGYEWVQSADETGELLYQKSETLTEGLSWTSVKPKVGKSYSEDALAEVLKFYQGFTIPEEGLIFACLMDDAGKTATGQSITNNGGVFGEHEGVPAVYLNGNSNLSIYSYDMDTVMGSNPSTMSCWLYFPEAQAMQEHPYYAFTYGNRSGGGQSRCIGVYGDGSVKADTWGGTTSGNILGGWHHVAAIFASNTVKLYIDGELSSYGSCDLYTQSPWIYIGCTSSSDPQFIGYVGPCRIYNRVLEEDEIMGLYKEYAGK